MTAGKPSLLKAPPFQRFNSSTVQRGGSPVDSLARARLQKWVHCAMRTLLSRAIQVDPSFHIGLGLIVILAVAEIFFAASYYVGRARAARISAQAVAANVARPAAPSVSAQTPAPAPAQPAVSPATVPAPSPSLVDQLLREGIELRDRGDTTNALARLQEALESEPNNATVLEEIAKTYESMQLFDRSNEMWRKLREMGPSAGAAYELADRRLKLGVPTPAPAPMPTAPDSSSREVSTSPYGTAADFAKYAIKPREHEIDQVPPLPTSTASEVSSPATRASPAEPGPSAETAVAQPGGRLIVLRAPNFGSNLALNLKIDGRTVANIVPGRRYDHFVPEGRHMLTVSVVSNYQPTSTVLNVRRGQTYVFTATRQNTDSGVVLVPSA